MRVLKFGGSSLATGQRFIEVASIIKNKSQSSRLAVVVSAPQGVTRLTRQQIHEPPLSRMRLRTSPAIGLTSLSRPSGAQTGLSHPPFAAILATERTYGSPGSQR